MSQAYRVRLFAQPLLEGPAGPCNLSPFQSALVTLVYAENGVTRGRVADLLWPGDTSPRTRHRLRQIKTEIRRKAGAHVIHSDGDRLVPSPAVSSDLKRVSGLLAGGRLLEAATVLSGNDGPEGLPESLADWREAFDDAARSRVLKLAALKWRTATTDSDWTEARDAAEAWCILSPGDPEWTARLIESRARVGRFHAAEVAYAEYSERTAEDERAEAVDAMIARVREATPGSATATGGEPVPFVGRTHALAELSTTFGEVREGRFVFALVSGEAGIGKTRLIREVERSARLEGIRCLNAEPVELEQRIAMNPVIDALSAIDLQPHLEAIGEPWRTVIGTMLPPGPLAESVSALPEIEEKSLSRRLFDAFSLLFRSISEEKPTILFLDDLHWADATTISTLQFFQRRWKESYFGVVATVRSEAVSRKHPAASYLADDGKLGVRRLELAELEESEARRLVSLVGRERIDESAIGKLCALSGCHPLYLTELTRDYVSGRLELPSSEADAYSVPISIRQILTTRLEGVSDDARSLLELLAAAGKPTRLADLATVLDISLDRTADATAELSAKQITDIDRGLVWIGHEVFRTAVYRALSDAHRAVLHHRLAEHLTRTRGDDVASELAIHLERAGRDDLAAQFGWTAAARAFERGAVAEAAHFYELVTRNERDEARRAEATALQATSLYLSRDMSRANPALELASLRLRAAGMAESARRMEIRRVEGLAEIGDTPVDELVERLAAIKEQARRADDWEAVALALDVELQQLQLAERLDGALSLLDELRNVLHHGDNTALGIAHRALAVGLMLCDPVRALESANQAVERSENLPPDSRLRALNRLLIVLLQQGRLHLESNQPFIAAAEHFARRSGDLLQRFSFEGNLGVSFMDAGDLERARVQFDKAGGLLGEADMTFPRINLAINRGELALAEQDFQSAVEHFREAGAHGGLAIPRYTTQLVNAGLGLCALEMGRVGEARRRHDLLTEPPNVWYYDPTPLLLFRSRFLELRRQRSEALDLLAEAQEDLKGRLVAAWIKTQLTRARLMKKAGDPAFTAVAEEGLAESCNLSLTIRQRQFRQLLH